MAFRLSRRGALGAIAAAPVAAKAAIESGADQIVKTDFPWREVSMGVELPEVPDLTSRYRNLFWRRMDDTLRCRLDDAEMGDRGYKWATKKSWSPAFKEHVRLSEAKRQRDLYRAINSIRRGDLRGLLRAGKKFGLLDPEEIGGLMREAKESAMRRAADMDNVLGWNEEDW